MTEDTDPPQKKNTTKFGTKAGQDELAESLRKLKERVQGIPPGTEKGTAPPSRYTKTQGTEFKITRGYKPVMDDAGDLSSRGSVTDDPVRRLPAQKQIKEAEKRIGLFQTFSQNAIQVQTQKIELESAKDAFQKGEYSKANEIADHILENLDDSFLAQVHEETAKGMSQAYSLISNARMLGIDVSESNKMMEDAQRAFLSDDYAAANRIINEVVNNINLTKNRHLKTVVIQMLDEVKSIISELPGGGPQLQGINEIYAKGESLYRRGNLDDAYTVSRQAQELARKMRDLYSKQ
jgi:tetratricopeptide (TPR) repeat protein